jgi:hypothetical protein
MSIKTLAWRLVSAVFVFLLVSSTSSAGARAVPTKSDELSDEEKSEIVESVLELELRSRTVLPEFRIIRNLSAENLEFVQPSQISKHGLTLVTPSQIRDAFNSIEYLLFREIHLHDGIVSVVLSRVVESHPCFAPPSSTERSTTYEFRKESGRWIGHFVKVRSQPPLHWQNFFL